MISARQLVIFDLDGCISDDRHRRPFLPVPAEHHSLTARDYDRYHADLTSDPIIEQGWKVLHDWCTNGAHVLIVTARPEAYRTQTLHWLHCMAERHGTPINVCALIMRKPTDKMHSPLSKVGMVWDWMRHNDAYGVDVVAAYDDRVDVLKAYAACGILSAGDCFRLDADGCLALTAIEQCRIVVSAGSQIDITAEDSETVPESLRSMASTYEERNKVYSDNYKRVGTVMHAMFPAGIKLTTAEDFTRWHLFELKIVKLTRFAVSGLTHKDSIHDDGVYSAMVEHLITNETAPIGGVN